MPTLIVILSFQKILSFQGNPDTQIQTGEHFTEGCIKELTCNMVKMLMIYNTSYSLAIYC